MINKNGLPDRLCPTARICPAGCAPATTFAWGLLIVAGLAKHLLLLAADPPPPQLDAFAYWRLGGELAAGDWLLASESGAFRNRRARD